MLYIVFFHWVLGKFFQIFFLVLMADPAGPPMRLHPYKPTPGGPWPRKILPGATDKVIGDLYPNLPLFLVGPLKIEKAKSVQRLQFSIKIPLKFWNLSRYMNFFTRTACPLDTRWSMPACLMISSQIKGDVLVCIPYSNYLGFFSILRKNKTMKRGFSNTYYDTIIDQFQLTMDLSKRISIKLYLDVFQSSILEQLKAK